MILHPDEQAALERLAYRLGFAEGDGVVTTNVYDLLVVGGPGHEGFAGDSDLVEKLHDAYERGRRARQRETNPPRPGWIVVPQRMPVTIGGPGEVIIGIVIDQHDDDDRPFVTVCWISSERGVFVSEENIGDVDTCDLAARAEIGDPFLRHEHVAADLLAEYRTSIGAEAPRDVVSPDQSDLSVLRGYSAPASPLRADPDEKPTLREALTKLDALVAFESEDASIDRVRDAADGLLGLYDTIHNADETYTDAQTVKALNDLLTSIGLEAL